MKIRAVHRGHHRQRQLATGEGFLHVYDELHHAALGINGAGGADYLALTHGLFAAKVGDYLDTG